MGRRGPKVARGLGRVRRLGRRRFPQQLESHSTEAQYKDAVTLLLDCQRTHKKAVDDEEQRW